MVKLYRCKIVPSKLIIIKEAFLDHPITMLKYCTPVLYALLSTVILVKIASNLDILFTSMQ